MTDVSVLGAGLMGAAIARRLLATGMTVTVWNRTGPKLAPLVDDGAVAAAALQDAFAASPLVIAVGLPYDTVSALVRGDGLAGTSTVLVQLTTGDPADADALERVCVDSQVPVLDGAIYGYPDHIKAGEAQIVYAGDSDVWRDVQSVLHALAPDSVYLGSQLRLANVLDCVMLSYTASMQAAVLEASAYGHAAGLPLSTLFGFFTTSAQSVGEFTRYVSTKLLAGDLSTSESTIDTWTAAVEGVAGAARSLGLPARQILAARDALRAAQAVGYGTADVCALFTVEDSCGQVESNEHEHGAARAVGGGPG